MRKTIIFDTSGLNKIADDPEHLLIETGLKSGFKVGLTLTSIEEIAATQKNIKRQHRLDLCKRLSPVAVCLMPFNWILEALIKTHQQNPRQFNWANIEIALPNF